MAKIATHDSGTGEKPANLLSYLLIPFTKAQCKTIKEQLESGSRMFDLRVKEYKGEWHLAHGAFISKMTFEEALSVIDSFGEKSYIMVTYEGKLKTDDEKKSFTEQIGKYVDKYENILWGPVCVKYTNDDIIVDWEVLIQPLCEWPMTKQGFVPLDGKHWQTYLPIPWLWKKIYYDKPKFNDEEYTYVDFL